MKGRTGDILTRERAEALIASLPVPAKCDGCDQPFGGLKPWIVKRGPFPIHLCARCHWRWMKAAFRKQEPKPQEGEPQE